MKPTRLTNENHAYLKDIENLENGVRIAQVVHNELTEKLGQLEDIEEELGIELTLLFKLIKARTLFAYGYNEKLEVSNRGVNIKRKTIILYNGACTSEYPLSGYGKHFALTMEELL